MGKPQKEHKERTVAEVVREGTVPQAFTERLAGLRVEQDGVALHLRPLDFNQNNYAAALAGDARYKHAKPGDLVGDLAAFHISLLYWQVRLAIYRVEGLCVEFEGVQLGPDDYQFLTRESMRAIPMSLLNTAMARMATINILSEAELDKLDFTTPSPATEDVPGEGNAMPASAGQPSAAAVSAKS